MSHAHVQTVSVAGSGTATNTIVTSSITSTTGNQLVAGAKWEVTGSTLSTVSDGTNSHTIEATQIHSGTVLHGTISHKGNITGVTGAITFTFTGLPNWQQCSVSEYSGMTAASNNLDQYITGTGTSTSPASGNVTTTQADEVCYCLVGCDTAVTFSALTINSVTATARRTVDDTTMFDTLPTATFGPAGAACTIGSAGWICALATFKAAAGGPSAGTDTATAGLTESLNTVSVTLSIQESG